MSSKSLGTLTLDLVAETGGFESSMDQAARVADKKIRYIEQQAKARAKAIELAFSDMAKSMAAPLAGAAIGIGGIASLDALKSSIESTIGGFAGLQDAAERTGATVEKLSGLKSVATLGGHDFAEVEGAIMRLNKALHGTDDESKGAGKALAALGLDLQALRAMDPAQAMLELAKAQDKFADGSGKSAAMMAILGKSGAAAIPFLKDLAEQGSLVGKVTTEQARNADEYEKNLKRLRGTWNNLSKQMAAAVVGPARDVTEWMVKAQKEGGTLQGVLVGIGAALTKAMGGEINPLKSAENDANELFTDLAKARDALSKLKEQQTTENPLYAFATSFDVSRLEKQIPEMEAKLKKAIAVRNRLLQKAADENEPKSTALNEQTFGAPGKEDKPAKEKAEKAFDPLADAAKTYASALETLTKHQREAETAGWNMTTSQRAFLDVATSPEWLQMPETWREIITQQAEFSIAAEQAANEQKRLNDLLAATPTTKLEAQQETMKFLAKAFEDGRISAQQFEEAAQAALGTLGDIAKPLDRVDMVVVNAFESMGDAFADFLMTGKLGFGDLVNSMIRDLIKLELQTQMTTLYREAGGLSGIMGAIGKMFSSSSSTPTSSIGTGAELGFDKLFANANGGVYSSPSLSAYSGGIYDTPKLFAFAKGAGVFGEAGPEAIMPLSRGSDGKLGVRVQGIGSPSETSVTINIDASGTKTEGDAGTARELGRRIETVVRGVLMTEKRHGGLLSSV